MRIIVVLLSVLTSIFLLAPSFLPQDSSLRGFLPGKKINLGLDLQGGIHVILGIDIQRALEVELDQLATAVRTRMEEEGAVGVQVVRSGPNQLRIDLRDPQQIESLRQILRDNHYSVLTAPSLDGDRVAFTSLEAPYREELAKMSLEQAREIIRNRVDEFGVAEPIIQIEGADRILIQLPGVQDPERALQLIGQTALLEYKLVDDEFPLARLEEIIDKHREAAGFTTQFTRAQLERLNEVAAADLPQGRIISFERVVDGRGGDVSLIPYLLHSEVALTGQALENAQVRTDGTTNQPIVALTFNAAGAEAFEEVTANNVQRRLGIILDDVVISAPVIQGRIAAINRGATITLGQGNRQQIMREARDLALVLRSGALPAPVEILENRTVGASLGQDSIEAGKSAGLIAALLVILFMLLYYRAFGLLADVVVAINILMILAVMALFQATLTLPGIAGIVLTIGIAVDANVIIFERIREELRNSNRKLRTSIEVGYNAAHKAILDANITTAIAAIVLFNFGSGPIRGFAVTLLVGIISGYITAFWFSRWILEWYLDRRPAKTLWI
jgi:protein-export membrane protein SecD